MTTDDEFIEQLEGYLDQYAGSTPLPEPVRHAVRAQLRTTRQLGPVSGPMRDLKMSNALRIGLAAAAVVVIAVGAYSLLPGTRGGPPTGAGPTPSPSPTVEPSVTASPGPSATIDPAALAPGSHTSGPDSMGLSYTFDIPSDGWGGLDGLDDDWPIVEKGLDPGPGAIVAIFRGATPVYADPCQWEGSEVEPPTTTVDAIAAALAAQPGRDATDPTDVTVSGYPGKLVELSIPQDAAFADCDQSQYRSWGPDPQERFLERWHDGAGEVDRVWILDVEGQVIVVDATWMPGTDPATVAEAKAIAESLVITAD